MNCIDCNRELSEVEVELGICSKCENEAMASEMEAYTAECAEERKLEGEILAWMQKQYPQGEGFEAGNDRLDTVSELMSLISTLIVSSPEYLALAELGVIDRNRIRQLMDAWDFVADKLEEEPCASS